MKLLSVTKNTIFTITEPQNLTTGYSLSITTSPSIRIINDTTVNSSNRIGAPQLRRWTLVAREVGVSYIVLLNARQWENTDPYTKIIKVNVT